MPERRTKDRRRLPLVAEPLEREGQRRTQARRQSPRAPAVLRVAFDGHEMTVDGEVGRGGASFLTRLPPRGEAVEVAFAAGEATFVAPARVVGRHAGGPLTRVRLAFTAALTKQAPPRVR